MARYWFRQKRFGYGATPSTWQGWTFTLLGMALLFAVVITGPHIRDNAMRALWMMLGIPAVLVTFCAVAHAKTEGGWRWRGGRE
ncbi:MAG TPA: hypothetical protein VHC40_02485 [Rhizomicrobium sp.]|jgi:hypothetical protein|nr:hypothetical protein [Rhizomicrobium sp.]